MAKKFQYVVVTTKENDIITGYYCRDRVTAKDILESNYIPEDLKVDPYIFNIRKSDDGRRKATIEPWVVINFAGSFVTDKDIFKSMKDVDDKFISIDRFHREKRVKT